MEQILTIVCKLTPAKEQVQKIEDLLKAFSDACIYANKQVDPKTTSKSTIQAIVYQDLRKKFELPAQLAVRACARVGANRKTAKQKGKSVTGFQPTSADYDARIFSLNEHDWTVGLTLLSGREKMGMSIGSYQKGKLKGRKPTSAQLCKHRDGNYYIHIQVKDVMPDPINSDKVIGVDFGRRDIAVTSEGDSWSGEQLNKKRDKYNRVRATLQQKASKGTRSGRRSCRNLLKRLSSKERRFQAHVNHVVSKTIILKAKDNTAIVAIEELSGIRERTNSKPRNKTERRRSNSWSFFELRTFLEYKGNLHGVGVVAIPPQYTSQTCHECLWIGERSAKSFKCVNPKCRWSGDADLNASKVIAVIGAVFVSLPGNPRGLYCELSTDSSGLLKAHTVPGTPGQCG
ncbi:MAG: transposase [Stigonema ocellatum SAG 48.90 = DSM 106950]|nr:transposase [Stigonema ocellatum SAG 48.90 = DSM 106950]